ncbi:MAG: DMT family transporter [Clostridia bacterium]|nr:DMT family transporter [Clostridia bacterium]
MKKKVASAALCLTAAVVWGSAFYAQELASQNEHLIDTFFFGGLRFLLGAVSLIPLILIFERDKGVEPLIKKMRNENTMKWGILTGAILFVASLLQQYGILLTQESGKAGFITGMYLIFVPIAGFIFFKQKISPLVAAAVVFAFSGLYFLCLGDSGFKLAWGDVLVFLCSICYTAHIIVIDRCISKVSALKYSAVQFATVGVLNLSFGLVFGHVSWEGIVATIFPILYCGIMSTGVAYTCQVVGQKFTPPAIAALLFSTEGLFSVICESIFEKRLPSTTMIIGCALMFIGIVLSQIPWKRKKVKVKSEE